MVVISVLLSLAGAMFIPTVLASSINPNLSWNPNVVFPGQTTTATYGVAANDECPIGDFFTGTLTVTEPGLGGNRTASVTQTNIPCGTVDLSTVYPTGFTGAASTQCPGGPYTAVWAGSTTAVVGGVNPAFSVRSGFDIPVCLKLPEFGGPAVLVAAVGLVVVAAMKRGKVLKF
jgi:hypothetical protein